MILFPHAWSFWSRVALKDGGGDSGGGDSGGGGGSSKSSGTRSEADIQRDINNALSASGGAWTSELNDLVAEREVARSGGGTTGGGGGSTAAASSAPASSSRPAPRPDNLATTASSDGGSSNVSVGYGAGQVDPALARAAGITTTAPAAAAPATTVTGGRGTVVEQPGARAAAAAADTAATFEDQAEQDDRTFTPTTVTGGRGTVVEQPGERAAALAERTAATFDAQAEQDDRASFTPTATPVTGGRGTVVEQPGERAAAATAAAEAAAAEAARTAATFEDQAEQDDRVFTPTAVTGGRGTVVEQPGERAAAAAAQPADNISSELTSLQDQIASLNDSISVMQDQDLVDQGLISALTNERDTLRTQFDDLNTTYDALNTELETSRSTISDLSTQIDDLNNNIAIMQDQDLIDQGLIDALNEQKSTLETERSTLQADLDDLTSSYDLLNETYGGTVADLDAANAALSDTKSLLGTTQSTLDETAGLLTASQALNASLSQQINQPVAGAAPPARGGLQTTPASAQNLSRIGDIDPSTVGVYANAPRSSTPAPAPVDYASLFDLTPEQEAEFRAGATAPMAGTSIDVLAPLGRPSVQGSDLTGNIVSTAMRTGQIAGRMLQSGAEAIAPQSTATIGYGEGQIDPALAAAAGYAPGAAIAVGEPNVVSQFGAEMAESFDRLAGRALSNTSPENRAAAVADIYDPETGLNFDALRTQALLSAGPTLASLSGLALGLPGVMLTGGAMQMGETAQQTLDNIDAAYARGELGPISPAQLEAMKSRALEINAPLSAATGAVTNAIYGSPLGIPARIGLGTVEGAVDEALLEPSIARTAANVGTGQGGVQGEVGTLNEAIIGGLFGAGANVATGAAVGPRTTVQGQGPSVMSQGPGQPVAPTMPGGPGTSVTSPAASAIAGAPLTGRTAPTQPTMPTTPTAPVVQTTTPAAPATPTTPGVIQIPGTDITVNTALPRLPGPETPPPALGTGGQFTPGRPALPAPDTAPQVDTTPPTSMDRLSQAADIINTEVAETGALSNETAQNVAQDYNLSMQEVANLAEEAMGVTPSEATGPSTALTVAPSTEVAVSPTQPTGIATITETQTQPEGYVFEGEILGPDTSVSTEVLPEEEGVIIEGEVPTTAVTVPPETVVTPTETVVTPTETTVLPTDTGAVVFTDTTDTGGDDEEVTVEVDETPPTDTGGGGAGEEDVVVDIGPPDEGDEGDQGCPEGYELQEVNGEMICVPIEAPFECPEGFEAVQVNGEWRCQATQAAPQRVRPRAGPYYRPNPRPAYTTRGS